MDIIAGIAAAIICAILFFIFKKSWLQKKFTTSLLVGFIVFIIFTGRVELTAQKIGIIAVTLLLIYAANLKVSEAENEPPQISKKKER